MRVSVLLWKNQVFDFPENPRKKVPAELRIPETYNFVREVQCFFFSRMQAVQNFAPRLTARSWVNIMLRRDSKVANECGKDAHACRRTSTSWSLNLFDKFGPIFKVAFVPYHRLHGGSWNAEFYRWLLLGCCGRSEA